MCNLKIMVKMTEGQKKSKLKRKNVSEYSRSMFIRGHCHVCNVSKLDRQRTLIY